MEEVVSEVFMICNAYESGVGHGYADDGLVNPYKEDTKLYEAYDLGYKQGLESKKEWSSNETL